MNPFLEKSKILQNTINSLIPEHKEEALREINYLVILDKYSLSKYVKKEPDEVSYNKYLSLNSIKS